MTKAILVIDMPKSCDECPIKWEDSDDDGCCGFIGILPYGFKQNYTKERVDGCPLKEIPKKNDCVNMYISDIKKYYARGYNACIDEILGGKENG